MGGVGWMGLDTVRRVAYNKLPIAVTFLNYGLTVATAFAHVPVPQSPAIFSAFATSVQPAEVGVSDFAL